MIGHYAGLSIQIHAIFMYMVIFCAILSFYIGFCSYINAILEDFRGIIGKLNILNDLSIEKRNQKSVINVRETMIEAIKLHTEMLQ